MRQMRNIETSAYRPYVCSIPDERPQPPRKEWSDIHDSLQEGVISRWKSIRKILWDTFQVVDMFITVMETHTHLTFPRSIFSLENYEWLYYMVFIFTKWNCIFFPKRSLGIQSDKGERLKIIIKSSKKLNLLSIQDECFPLKTQNINLNFCELKVFKQNWFDHIF